MQRGSPRGDQAKLAIILAAERLFADRGYRAVSMREIGAAAGQRNNSAAQYHFGSRRGLIEAILEYRMTPFNDRRLEILAGMAAEGRSHDLRSLVEALALPWIESLDLGHSYWARFLLQVAFSPENDLFAEFDRPYAAGLRIVEEGILHAMDHLPPAVAAQRLVLVNRLMISAVADQERLAERHRRAEGGSAGSAGPAGSGWGMTVPSDLIDMAVAMVMAPVSEDTLQRAAEIEQQLGAAGAGGAGAGAQPRGAKRPGPERPGAGTKTRSGSEMRAVARGRSQPATRKAVP